MSDAEPGSRIAERSARPRLSSSAVIWAQRLRKAMSGDGLRGRITRASGAALVIKILNAALGFATTVVLARTLGPDSFGVYAFALAVVMVVGLPAKGGVPQLVTRETAKGQASGQWGTVKAVWRWSSLVVLGVSAGILLVAVAAGVALPGYFRTEPGITLAIGLLMIPLMGLALVRASALRGLGQTVQGQLPELLIKPLAFLALLLGVLLLSGNVLSATWAMALNIVATAVAFAIGALMLRCARPTAVDRAVPIYESRTWFATIIPLALTNSMLLVNTQADILLIGIFMEHADAGHYKVAVQFSLLVGFGLQATRMVVEPYYSRFYHLRDIGKLQNIARAVSRINLGIAIVLFMTLLFLGNDLLRIAFGVSFGAAFLPTLVLSFGRLAGAALGSAGAMLVMAGYHNMYTRICIISTASNITLNLILIPLYGLMGAAIATAVTFMIPSFLGWRAAKKWVGVDCSPFSRGH